MAFSFSPLVIYPTGVLPAGNTTVYTAPSTANTNVIVQKTVVSNPTGTAATIAINHVSYGGTVTNSNVLLTATTVAAGATYISNEMNNLVLAPGDFIVATVSTAATLNLTISGVATVNS